MVMSPSCCDNAEEQLGAGQLVFSRPGADVYSGFLFVGGYGSIYGMQRSCGAEVGFLFPRAAEAVYSVFTI